MPKLRNTSPSTKAAQGLSDALTKWLLELRIDQLFVTCLSCKHLKPDGTGCSLYPDHPIPPHVVVTGCERYKDKLGDGKTADDDIPF